MNIRIFAAGKPALKYAKSGIEEYLKRLTRYAKVELIYLKAGTSEAVSADLLTRSTGSFRIALDERGKDWNTDQLVKRFNDWEMDPGIKNISLLIGASDGHIRFQVSMSDALRSSPFGRLFGAIIFPDSSR